MNHLHTVYDFSGDSMHQTFLIPLVFAMMGIYILAYTYGLTNYYIAFLLSKFRTKQQAIVIGLSFTLIAGFITLLVFNENYDTYHHYKHLYAMRKYTVTEGKITDLRRSPNKIQRPEHFTVNNIYFEVGDYDTEGYGYSQTSTPDFINQDIFVRITYFNNGSRNVILKLETE